MTKRAVWIVSLALIVLSIASVAYRLAAPSHFDSALWRGADEPAEFLDRRAMLPALEQMFAKDGIDSMTSARQFLGEPERTEENRWLYSLGGQRSASAPESTSYLELTFNDSGTLVTHRITQELLVPN